MRIYVDRKELDTRGYLTADSSYSDSDGSSGTGPMLIYESKVDLAGVPRQHLFKEGDEDNGCGSYGFPKDDDEVLEWSGWPEYDADCAKRFDLPLVYRVDCDYCTFKKFDKLLSEIGCGHRFIACAVSDAHVFFAGLEKKEASRLRGLDGVRSATPYEKKRREDEFAFCEPEISEFEFY